MELLFWIVVAVMAWCFAGYPLFIVARARWFPRPLRTDATWKPRVSVIVTVRNSRDLLERRIDNLLTQDYPAELLDVVVAYNDSTDGTDELAHEIARREPRVRAILGPSRQGKAGAVNHAMAQVTSDIVVYADARQTYTPDAVSRLVAPFADPTVGAATGRWVVKRAEQASVEVMRKYWGLETALRDAESRTGSVIGATGAIYAIRRALFAEIPPNMILDDVFTPMQIGMRGYRVVMAFDAIAYDVPAKDRQMEFERKRRNIVGNLQLMRALPALLSPVRNPLWVRFMSHKFLRLCLPVCCLLAALLSALLPGTFYHVVFGLALAGYALGTLGLVADIEALSLPATFVMLHGAVFSALARWRQDATQVWARPTATVATITTDASATPAEHAQPTSA